jgi:hypothetical protein
MRTKLSKYTGQRLSFTASIGRFGQTKVSNRTVNRAICLENLTTKKMLVADHVWLLETKSISVAHIKPGDIIQFNATVQRYPKGYQGYNRPPVWDYGLSCVSDIGILGNYIEESSS